MTEQDVITHEGDPPIQEADSVPGEVTEGYVGVIYFHGMGEQRRMEEVSRLVESIDTYLRRSRHVHGQPLGYLKEIKTVSEPHRVKNRNEEQVYYTKTRHFAEGHSNKNADGKPDPVRAARFFEVYWAPQMAQGRNPLGVTKWIMRQIWRPFIMMVTPWRERQRLRRATLAEMAERAAEKPEGTPKSDFEDLLTTYYLFGRGVTPEDDDPASDGGETTAALKDSGKFSAFETFLKRTHADDPDKATRLTGLAKTWWWKYFYIEVFNLGVMITVALAGLMVAGVFVSLVLSLLSLTTDYLTGFNIPVPDWLSADWTTAAGLAGSLAIAGGLGKFLGSFMGDVEAWASLSETDALHERRKAVLNEGMDVMRHVLSDPKCKRVIVVGHSLGTSVAHDTLLALAQRNHGHNNNGDVMKGPVALTKIRHLVTIASPIDKINYFFESYRTGFAHYSRAYESMRGDIKSPPFSRNESQPYIHWVNYWDLADVISGSLQSPTGADSMTNRVNNVHISNLHFPSPGAAHSAYFQNRTVISQVFDMIYFGRGNYDGDTVGFIDDNPRNGRDYTHLDFKSDANSNSGAIYRFLATLVIWGAALALAGWFSEMQRLFFWPACIAAVSAFFLYIGWGSSFRSKNKEPL
ncbi:hypothetical protein AB3Y40_18125 [Yoonia sp. R2331]|uniref:hypothetical protein n=1 Tax=Yoonia sp. R2331 TaxID=3237238 RepID=UPI0034E3B69A